MERTSYRLSERSGARLWAGRALSLLLILFLLVDAGMKIARTPATTQATVQMLGYQEATIQAIGFVLLICTAIYAFPRTSVIGAILLTGYLGGAIASGVRAGTPIGTWIFPFLFGVLVWFALWLRDRRIDTILQFD